MSPLNVVTKARYRADVVVGAPVPADPALTQPTAFTLSLSLSRSVHISIAAMAAGPIKIHVPKKKKRQTVAGVANVVSHAHRALMSARKELETAQRKKDEAERRFREQQERLAAEAVAPSAEQREVGARPSCPPFSASHLTHFCCGGL